MRHSAHIDGVLAVVQLIDLSACDILYLISR